MHPRARGTATGIGLGLAAFIAYELALRSFRTSLA